MAAVRARRHPPFRSRSALACVVLPWLALGCSDDDPAGPAQPLTAAVFALNSTGQTMAAFEVATGLTAGPTVDLGAGFDGTGMDLSPAHAVVTVSSFSGSQIRFVDRSTSEVQTVLFPGPDGAAADPGLATFDADGTAWVGGRGADAVFHAAPGESEATLLAADVGEYVTRVVPVGPLLWAIDANLDDDGFTFDPLGPGRIVVLDRGGTIVQTLALPVAAPNPIDAVLAGSRLVVLGGGTFAADFTPNGDGTLVLVDTGTGSVSGPFALGGNAVAIERGADGRVYVTRTADYTRLDLLVFDPVTGEFVHGPDEPLAITDASGVRVDCWAVTALSDARLLCATFDFAEPGRLILADGNGTAVSELASGFGTTDLHVE